LGAPPLLYATSGFDRPDDPHTVRKSICQKRGSAEFLFPCYEIQDAGTMKEGTVPVPHIPPLRRARMTEYLSGVVYRIRGSHSGGGETPYSG